VWLRSALQRVFCRIIEFEQRTKPGSVSDTFVEPLNKRIEFVVAPACARQARKASDQAEASVVETYTQNPEPSLATN